LERSRQRNVKGSSRRDTNTPRGVDAAGAGSDHNSPLAGHSLRSGLVTEVNVLPRSSLYRLDAMVCSSGFLTGHFHRRTSHPLHEISGAWEGSGVAGADRLQAAGPVARPYC
jgi:hypothetical protein